MATMYNLRIRSRHPSHKVLRRNRALRTKQKVVYRLGSTTESEIPLELNSIESIKNSSNKFLMKELFKKNNIPSTNFFYLNDLPDDLNSLNFPLLAKLKYGSKGKGMFKLDTPEQLREFLSGNTKGYYLEEYFSGSREYRLHVSALGCFYACRKLRKTEASDRWYFNSNNCIWATEKVRINNPDGSFSHFSEEDSESFNKPNTWENLITDCQNAIAAVGLDIGAVDVRMNKKGEYKILETNSAPSFGEITSIMYEEHLPKLIKFKFN